MNLQPKKRWEASLKHFPEIKSLCPENVNTCETRASFLQLDKGQHLLWVRAVTGHWCEPEGQDG